MSDAASSGAATPSSSDDRTLAFVVYVLMFAAPFVVGLTGLIGVVIAYVRKPEAPPLEASHYRFQIRTFWVGFALALISALALVVGVGVLFFDILRHALSEMPSDAWDAVSRDMEMSFPVVTFVGVLVAAVAWVACGFWMVLTSLLGALRLSTGKPFGRPSA